jgi:helicase
MQMKIRDLPLPKHIIEHLENLGYSELYPPQKLAVEKGLFSNKNMVIATPTASGKTFIAILAAIHQLLVDRGSKIIYLVPLKALASEKYREFSEVFKIPISNRRVRISIATGDYDTPGEELKYADIIIATNERMDSILRHSPSWINKIRLVIADEGHLIGVSDRGPVLESLLTRLKIEFRDIRIIVLSATISNKGDFKQWLKANVIYSDWRPVPLREGVIYDHMVVYSDYSEKEFPRYTGDPILDNAYKTVEEGGQVIIFTQTRREAVGKAKKYSEFMRHRTSIFDEEEKKVLEEASRQILERGEVTDLSKTLSNVLKSGVAFHHAGLSPTHREIVEDLFRRGYIKLLTATPTLAAGVNLPSRKVIITYTSRRGFGGYQEDISVFEYKQMAGRAGRPQYDESGEALLYSRYENLVEILIETYLKGEPEPLVSHLLEGENLESQLLGLAATYRKIGSEQISNFLFNTLCSIQEPERRIMMRGQRALETLIDGGLMIYNRDRDIFRPTALGQRTAELYILPSTAIYLKDVVIRNRNIEKPPEPLLLLYYISKTHDMGVLNVRKKEQENIIRELETRYMDVLGDYLHGLIENYMLYYDEREMSAWKIAFVLRDWIEEKSENDILRNWGVEPGDLYIIRSNAEWLCYAAREISRLFKNTLYEKEYTKLVLRVRHGVKEELLPLVEIPGIGRRRARALYIHGYKRLADFRNAREEELISIPGIGKGLAKKLIEEARGP